MLALGGAYFIAACTLDVMTNVGTIDDLTSSARIFLVLPVAVLDAVFILWIFTALSKTLAQLQVGATWVLFPACSPRALRLPYAACSGRCMSIDSLHVDVCCSSPMEGRGVESPSSQRMGREIC